MILDTNILTDVKTSSQWVIGKAAKRTGLLKRGEIVLMFDGIQSALHYINKHMPTPRHDGSSMGGSGHKGNTFSSYKQAMETFTQRPHEVVKYDPTEMRPIEFEEQGNDLDFDVTGDFLDVGRVLEGVPENFGSLHNGNPRSRRVRIVVGLSQAWWMEPHDIDHRSERVIRLIDALENARVRTELNAVQSSQCAHLEVMVKRFDEPLTIEDVAVATHSEFFRRMGFRVSEYSDTWQYGYGDSEALHENVNVLESQLNDELTVYVDGNLKGSEIDPLFNELEKTLEAELSEPVPSIHLINLDRFGVKNKKLVS